MCSPWASCSNLERSHLEGFSSCSCDCRRRRDLDEEAAEGASSGEDEFYDRTAETKKRKAKAAAVVEDAASLYGRKVSLLGLRCRVSACYCHLGLLRSTADHT